MDPNKPQFPRMDTIPEIDLTDYPDLPVIESPDGVFLVQGGEWDNPEADLFASAFITCCIEKGNWCAVGFHELLALFARHPKIFTPQVELCYLGMMFAFAGTLELILVGDQEYFIPTLNFVEGALVG